MKFTEFHLEQSLISAIEKLGYSECTPIQGAAIPHILEGRDISGLAQTGTGKTAAFVIPLMDRILKGRLSTENLSDEEKQKHQLRSFADWKAQNFILILVPTRELAEQVYENIVKLSEFSGLRGVSVYGGTSYEKQKEAFKTGVEFVVATPGRLIDLYKEHVLDLKQVRAIVFDEADRMFDMGFKDDMKFILSRVPRERQFLVFSATLNFDVLNTAYQFGSEPIEIDLSRDQAKAENVKDQIFHVGHHEKPMYLLSLIKKLNPRQVIIFSNFKMNVERIASFLSRNNIPAMGISSLLTQAQRNRVIELFKAENEKNILVATDVAARGLDIKGVDLVINYELPNDAESYVHRIGRTGRAGAEGTAYSLVCDRDVESLTRIEDYLKHKIEMGWLDDQDMVREFQAFPSEDLSPGNSMEKPKAQGEHRGGHGRAQHGRPRGERSHAGGRSQGGRGPQGRHPRREGERSGERGGERPQHGDRRQGAKEAGQRGGQQFRDKERQHAKGGAPHAKSGHPHSKSAHHKGPHAKPAHAKRPHQGQAKPSHGGHAKPAPQKAGIGGKVAKFFKNLFGG